MRFEDLLMKTEEEEEEETKIIRNDKVRNGIELTLHLKCNNNETTTTLKCY